ncbi:site-specific DNA-methyltransferase [Reinekea sp. G2M2-21]|uniref:DNA-methyltransferase n=1 Tax=Reinekea sp. G2M2-21 TaxID=2788942 RepID=UPI0018AB9351|nr:site-specific DNA-methyltransferase [Reinekea sp. G2M2-21]
MTKQLSLFDTFEALPDGVFSNKELYQAVADRFKVGQSDVNQDVDGVKVWKRRRRYDLQGLKLRGLVERVGNDAWTRTGPKSEFHTMIGSQVMLAYSTELGCALWGSATNVAESIDEPIHLMFTSPPYPLAVQRNYGQGPRDSRVYIDWLMSALEPVVKRLAPGGTIALNLGHDVFSNGSPGRSTYKERLIIEIEDNLGLIFMDSIIWISNKMPGPAQWAQKNTMQLYAGYEPIIWFTNDPIRSLADNTRISTLDGALNRNVWHIGNVCAKGRALSKQAPQHRLPVHQAMMPSKLARTAIEFWTTPGQLVVDLFSGTNTTGTEAELLNRRWIAGDIHRENLELGLLRLAS